MHNKFFPGFLAVLFLGGCTWVDLTEQGQNVAILPAEEVEECIRVGETTVSVVDKVILSRSDEKVETELQTLARNTAAERAADSIVATSPVQDGTRDYDIYRCRP